MSIFGLLPFGNVAPWGGPGLISIVQMLVIGTNSIGVFFTSPPKWRDPLGFRDSRNIRLWGVEAVDPIHLGLNGEVIVEQGRRRPTYTVWVGEVLRDDQDETQIVLRTVPQLEPGVDYDVTLLGPIKGATCENFGGLATFRLRAIQPPGPSALPQWAAQDTFRDYANPYFVTDPNTGQLVPGPGVWQYDEAGEIVLDDNAASLKKRVLRRIQTETGGFVHLPRYGTVNLKGQVARPAQVQAYALRLQEQIRSEPDVRDAAVAGVVQSTPQGGIVIFTITVIPKSAGEITFRVQVPAGSA